MGGNNCWHEVDIEGIKCANGEYVYNLQPTPHLSAYCFEKAQCSEYTCSAGWVKDADKTYGSSDAECCKATCEGHTCGAGLVNDATKNALTEPTDEKCCKQATC